MICWEDHCSFDQLSGTHKTIVLASAGVFKLMAQQKPCAAPCGCIVCSSERSAFMEALVEQQDLEMTYVMKIAELEDTIKYLSKNQTETSLRVAKMAAEWQSERSQLLQSPVSKGVAVGSKAAMRMDADIEQLRNDIVVAKAAWLDEKRLLLREIDLLKAK